MNTFLIDGVPYAVGDLVTLPDGRNRPITKIVCNGKNDDLPLKVDTLDGYCRYYGPNATDPTRRVTLAEPITYPEKPETLRRAGPEWGNLGTLEGEHNIAVDGETEPEAYTLES